MATTTHDYGNNETKSTGIVYDWERGGCLALTLCESKHFKTRRGAIAWLARRGYDADGKKL